MPMVIILVVISVSVCFHLKDLPSIKKYIKVWYLPMAIKRSISTVTLPGNLEKKLRACSDAGFDGVELYERDLLYFDSPPKSVAKMIADFGLEIVSYHPFGDFEGMPDPYRTKAFERAKRKFDLMGELGADTLLVPSNCSRLAIDDPERAAQDLADLADLAKGYNIQIGYGIVPNAKFVTHLEQAWSLVRAVDHSNLGVVVNSFHMQVMGDALDVMAEIPVEKIVLAKVADGFSNSELDPFTQSRHLQCFPGQGDFPVESWYQNLVSMGYEGYLSVQAFNDGFRAFLPSQIAIDGFRSLIYLEEECSAREVSSRQDLVTRFEFIEFASGGCEAEWLASFFESLGFVLTHKHRSKDIVLYRQGAVNFIINREHDCYASSFHEYHGTGVCAVGLASFSVSDLVSRSKRYRGQDYHGEVFKGELETPAVNGVDSLLYFVDVGPGKARFFDVDFEELCSIKSDDYGIDRVTHITHAVDASEVSTAYLMYRVLLGLQPYYDQEVPDPHGIANSRALKNSDGSVVFSLSSSSGSESSTQRFRSRFGGSGVEQISLGCQDIFTVAKNINPLNVLPVPENYYDDLEVRFSLSSSLVERLKKYNILYDEAGDGCLYQLSTRNVNGCFFNIIQNINFSGYSDSIINTVLEVLSQEAERSEALTLKFPKKKPNL